MTKKSTANWKIGSHPNKVVTQDNCSVQG